jgi:hypothetical protein
MALGTGVVHTDSRYPALAASMLCVTVTWNDVIGDVIRKFSTKRGHKNIVSEKITWYQFACSWGTSNENKTSMALDLVLIV